MLLWYFLADMSSCDGAHMAYEAEYVYYVESGGNCWLTPVVELFSSITKKCQNLCNRIILGGAVSRPHYPSW